MTRYRILCRLTRQLSRSLPLSLYGGAVLSFFVPQLVWRAARLYILDFEPGWLLHFSMDAAEVSDLDQAVT
jgi:hypothetical protein